MLGAKTRLAIGGKERRATLVAGTAKLHPCHNSRPRLGAPVGRAELEESLEKLCHTRAEINVKLTVTWQAAVWPLVHRVHA